jgi:uncharacterized membrane protein
MNNSQIKARAKDAMKNNWGVAIVVFLVYGLITSALSATGIGALATGLLTVGISAFFLTVIRNGKAEFESFFNGLTDNIGTKFISMLLVQIYIMLWTLLFYIPGIVKSYSYAMTPYILLDKPELSATDAITESRNMMNGHKMELFLLDLSFIGWILLSLLTCGILFFYVAPYMQAARAEFYRTLKGEDEAPAQEEPVIEIPH